MLALAQIREFFQIGYFTIPGLFSQKEIGHISHSFDRLYQLALSFKETSTYNNTQFVKQNSSVARIVWCKGAEPSLAKFTEDERLLLPSAQLLGSAAMEQLICQAHYKMPGDEVSFPWHQDSQHRRYGSEEWHDVNGCGSYVQTLIAIDDLTEKNATLYFIPFSGKAGHLFLEQDDAQRQQFNIKDAVPIVMAKGDVAFFSPYIVHGSFPNQSNHSRRVFINGYAYCGANRRIYPGCGKGLRLTSKEYLKLAARWRREEFKELSESSSDYAWQNLDGDDFGKDR